MSGCGWMRLTACAKWILTIVVTIFNVRWTRFAPIRWSLAKWFFKAICQYMAKWGKVAWWYYECIFILLLIYFLERFSKLLRSSIIDESLIFFPLPLFLCFSSCYRLAFFTVFVVFSTFFCFLTFHFALPILSHSFSSSFFSVLRLWFDLRKKHIFPFFSNNEFWLCR